MFISKPNALTQDQNEFWGELKKHLRYRDLIPRTLGETDFPNCTPIQAVKELLSVCQGALVLGFTQVQVVEGYSKPATELQKAISNEFFPTPWNHIEAGMAFMQGLPLMIIREQGVSGGVFDVGITDRFVHQAELKSEWLNSEKFIQPFGDWAGDVMRRPPARTIGVVGFDKVPNTRKEQGVNVADFVTSQDGTLKVTLTTFDPSKQRGFIKIEELSPSRGRFYVTAKFASGGQTRIDYKTWDLNKISDHEITTSVPNDSVNSIEIVSVGSE